MCVMCPVAWFEMFSLNMCDMCSLSLFLSFSLRQSGGHHSFVRNPCGDFEQPRDETCVSYLRLGTCISWVNVLDRTRCTLHTLFTPGFRGTQTAVSYSGRLCPVWDTLEKYVKT